MSVHDDPEYRKHYMEAWVKTELASRLRALREEQRKTQAEVAAQSGKSLGVVYRMENARFDTNPRLQTLIDVAAALGVWLEVKLVPYEEGFTANCEGCLRLPRT